MDSDIQEDSMFQGRALYYSIVANAAKAKLLESIVNTNLFDLFAGDHPVSESHIISRLKLHKLRARKWLHMLVLQKYLDVNIHDEPHYVLGKIGKLLYSSEHNLWWQCVQMVNSWQVVAREDITQVLMGGAVQIQVDWPPKTLLDAQFLEEWMTKTSIPPFQILCKVIKDIPLTTKRILDVGGGDGTISCGLAKQFSNIKLGLYNLPNSITLAKVNIENHDLSSRIKPIPGDFISEDSLPTGYDCVLFCRILWDWPSDINLKLLKMAYEALPENGYVLICEAFQESNQDFAFAWEFRYIYWDAFEPALFKTSDEYKAMLTEVGFKTIEKMNYPGTSFSVLVGIK